MPLMALSDNLPNPSIITKIEKSAEIICIMKCGFSGGPALLKLKKERISDDIKFRWRVYPVKF